MMDLKPFKLDIDELVHEFSENESTTLSEFKRVWLSRKFSFMFEASPSTNQGFFMQSLYAHSIGRMFSTGSLSTRLGGLYCLYCLYETQPFKPPFKIYLSLGGNVELNDIWFKRWAAACLSQEELRQLKTIALDAKRRGVKVVSTLLKSMLERDMFLFGSEGVTEGSATKRVNDLTDIQNASVQTAYKKLFANSRLEHFIHMDLSTELDVNLLKKKSSEYALAKETAIKEAGQVLDVQNIKHIAENTKLIGEVVEKTATEWNFQKETLYERTGIVRPDDEHASYSQIIQNDNSEEHENFGNELEVLLTKEG